MSPIRYGAALSGCVAAALLAITLTLPKVAYAVPANPEGVQVAQPDGSQVTVYLKGDEHVHWHQDRQGFLVEKSAKTDRWVYAQEFNGKIVPTEQVAGKADPVKAGIKRPNISRMVASSSTSSTPTVQTASGQSIKTGVMHNLVVLVNFSDLSVPYTTQQFDDLFNQVGYTADGAVGSVKDYYHEVSYNQLTVESTVVGPVTLDYSYIYYGSNVNGQDAHPRDMVSQALAKLEASGFDFSTMDGDGDGWVDGLTIIHAGGGEEYSGNDANYIWSHMSQLTRPVTYDGVKLQRYHTESARRGWDSMSSTQGITRIGVICHENAHFLGLPDLYDTGYDSSGVGRFCLMGSGSWGGGDGRRPTQMSAWCKASLGWISPTVISSPGAYSLDQVETSGQVCKLQGPFASSQYFLMENRQGTGFDAALPGSSRGMLIWHIDESMTTNDNQAHYKVDLEEASGTQHLEQSSNVTGDDADYFRSGTLTGFTDTTLPNSLSYSGLALCLPVVSISASGPSMTFNIQGDDTTPPNGTVSINSGAAYTNATSVTLTHSATDDVGLQSMRCSNDGANWSAWVPYASQEAWSLSAGDGAKTVYVQYRDTGGNVSSACSDTIILDSTPPTSTIATDEGAYTASQTLTFVWTPSFDSGSGIASYNCTVGTTPGANDIFSGSAGNLLSLSIAGTQGKICYCSVQAVDNAGNVGPWSAASDGIAVVANPGISINEAKALPDQSSAGLALREVTAVFADCIYIEEPGRNSAIRVVPAAVPVGLKAGSLVDVGGTLKTTPAGERYVEGVITLRG